MTELGDTRLVGGVTEICVTTTSDGLSFLEPLVTALVRVTPLRMPNGDMVMPPQSIAEALRAAGWIGDMRKPPRPGGADTRLELGVGIDQLCLLRAGHETDHEGPSATWPREPWEQ